MTEQEEPQDTQQKESQYTSRNRRDKERRRLWIGLWILLLLILGLSGLGIYGYLNSGGGKAQEPPGEFVLDPNAGEGEQTAPAQGEGSPGIQIPGYPEIPLTAGSANMYVALWNPESNPCYFKFQLILEANNEVLYTSDWVPPGKTISQQTLSRGLEAGEYAAVIWITTASLSEEHYEMNGSKVKTTLRVS
ncbi:MAG: hypothetical protein ACK5MN_03630 [Lachnospiraceae bacterium]